MRKSTLVFLISDNEILLAMKKRGFGKGKWNGVGGKPEVGESINETAIRECEEEINVTPKELKLVAKLNFIFPQNKSDWNQQVHVFTCRKWVGEPSETDEMKPEWCSVTSIPYDQMWDDDIVWLPLILKGRYVEASFEFNDSDKIINQSIEVNK